ncbi:MAG TPA: pantoate--beta-alanine ligase [Thermodesulfobacteriota bacterium]|nr:pantoate--beta-alanine ligase [Thermodesulfobacteriota bacterium]
MKLITSVKEMRVFSGDAQRMGRSVVFVPTMGYLHDGHASLLKKGRSLGDMLVMSIFVNPVQFGPGEDFASYPGDLKRDLALSDANKVDCVFNPAADEMYPEGFQTFIEIERLSSHLCGLSRPGHFRGVATVVMKLFNIVKPDIAIFGEKDFQQTAIIKRMIRDFNMDIDIVSMPIVRDADGLAMSSRNSYLNKEERMAARCLYTAIKMGRDIFNKGIKGAAVILKKMKHVIESEPLAVIEYIKICDTDTLEDLDIIADMALLVLSVKIGKTRLIDNCILQSHDRFKL